METIKTLAALDANLVAHCMKPPDLDDLRWTCTNCGWTASSAFSTPAGRTKSFTTHHEES